MKKTGLIIALFMIMGLAKSYAEKKETPFQFGFRFAPNIGWIKPGVEGYSGDGITMGFNWGFVGEYKFAENYSICSGFTIPMNAGKLKYSYADGKDTGTMYRRYSYKAIEIPILLKMQTKEIGYFTYFMQMGIGTSINIAAKAKDEFNVFKPTEKILKTEPNIKSSTRFLRESMIIAVGAQYNISGNTQIFSSLTFDNGFTNILKGKNPVSGKSESAISNYIEFSIGVLF